MKPNDVVTALAALAQKTRLAIFRLLVEAGPDGLAAGDIAARLNLQAPTLSFHLKALAQANLILPRPESRFIFYAANYPAMDDLLAFLTDNCCDGGACLPKTARAGAASGRRKSASTTRRSA